MRGHGRNPSEEASKVAVALVLALLVVPPGLVARERPAALTVIQVLGTWKRPRVVALPYDFALGDVVSMLLGYVPVRPYELALKGDVSVRLAPGQASTDERFVRWCGVEAGHPPTFSGGAFEIWTFLRAPRIQQPHFRCLDVA